LAGIVANSWDVVVLRSQDRGWRHPAELERLINIASASNVRIEAVHGGEIDLRTRQGRMMARMKTAFSIDEIDATRERVTDWHADRVKQGLPGPGYAGYGFKADKVTIDPKQAAIIREAADRVLNDESVASIVRDLTKRRVGPPRQGGKWYPSTLAKCLKSPRIAGLRSHRGEVVGKGTWDPILDETTWRRVCRKLTNPARRTVKTTSYNKQQLLTGIVMCGACSDKTLNSTHAKDRRKYYCRWCHGIMIDAEHLEDFMGRAVTAAMDPKQIQRRRRALADKTAPGLLGEIEQLEAELEELAHQRGAGELTAAEHGIISEGIRNRLATARRRYNDNVDTGYSVAVFDRWAGTWNGLYEDDQRKIIGLIFESVVIGPARRGINRFDPDRVQLTFRV
jgi:hypothetical protein